MSAQMWGAAYAVTFVVIVLGVFAMTGAVLAALRHMRPSGIRQKFSAAQFALLVCVGAIWAAVQPGLLGDADHKRAVFLAGLWALIVYLVLKTVAWIQLRGSLPKRG